MTNEEATLVFDLAHFFWPSGSTFRFFAKSESKVFGCAIHNPHELAVMSGWADRNGYNSYWGINPTHKRIGTRCSSLDILAWCFFPLDIDPVAPCYDAPTFLERAEIALLDELPKLDPRCRLLISSGRGLQALYPVTPLIFDDSGIRTRLSRALNHLLNRLSTALGTIAGCQLDPSCSDLPRVMRLPFTLNQKTGRRANILKTTYDVALPDPRAILDLHDAHPGSVTAQRLDPQDHWINYIPHMTAAGRRFLQEGSASPGRHRAATAAMLSLLELGADEPQVLSALRVGAVLCEPPLPHRDIENMVERRFRLTGTVLPRKIGLSS